MRIPIYFEDGKVRWDTFDNMSSEQLMYVWRHHSNGRNFKELFRNGGKNSQKIAKEISNYASNMATVKTYKALTSQSTLQQYLTICEGIRKEIEALIHERWLS